MLLLVMVNWLTSNIYLARKTTTKYQAGQGGWLKDITVEQSRELQAQLGIRKSREVSLMFRAPPSLSLLSINSRRGKREVEQLSGLFETCSRHVTSF